MPKSEKYYAANCNVELEELRIVKAKSPAAAAKKLENGDYDYVISGQIGAVRSVMEIPEVATPELMSHFQVPRSAKAPKRKIR